MNTTATEDTLNDIMDLDHVIEVLEDGSINTDTELYAPSITATEGEEPDVDAAEEWQLLSGYTGQYSYNGPVMHDSEYIGGRLAADILAKPGFYVAVPVVWLDVPEDEDNMEGWVVAHLPKA